jgi:hypothetical protein
VVHHAGECHNLVEYALIVPPIAFGGTVGMKAPATGTGTVPTKIGTEHRSSINKTLPLRGLRATIGRLSCYGERYAWQCPCRRVLSLDFLVA